MAEIRIAGIDVDTEDVDLLAKYCPMADLDRAIKADYEILASLSSDDPLRAEFTRRLGTHRTALEIAESAWNNGEVFVPQPRNEPSTYYLGRRVQELSDYARQVEGNLASLRETLKEHVSSGSARRPDRL